MSIKSDLASEIIEGISEKDLPEIKYHRFGGIDVTKIEIEREVRKGLPAAPPENISQ